MPVNERPPSSLCSNRHISQVMLLSRLMNSQASSPVSALGISTTPLPSAAPKLDLPKGRPPHDKCLWYEQTFPASTQLRHAGFVSSHRRWRRRHSLHPLRDLLSLGAVSLDWSCEADISLMQAQAVSYPRLAGSVGSYQAVKSKLVFPLSKP